MRFLLFELFNGVLDYLGFEVHNFASLYDHCYEFNGDPCGCIYSLDLIVHLLAHSRVI